ncbi:hypothetical protein EF294_03175 [Gordonia oryzae]|uniref:Uncharacterized protein n=1 Tax=Gordonia oryzae TaxID=2487349 RepID=A0A3N4GS15_9ACTN|nr:hypothetical protein [Gordonia oryzae]RPA65753.1 hypothetical protein EF294_03175 [Gordonia oryzae]
MFTTFELSLIVIGGIGCTVAILADEMRALVARRSVPYLTVHKGDIIDSTPVGVLGRRGER